MVYFSKKYFHLGYHPIRVQKLDVHKTTFRCHFGHFEYLVMAFGLSNAPTTFYSCINHVFNKYLHKFVLVFFDDILIYSKSWEERLGHLDEVLGILATNSLFVKASKCDFDMTELLFLGNVIVLGNQLTKR